MTRKLSLRFSTATLMALIFVVAMSATALRMNSEPGVGEFLAGTVIAVGIAFIGAVHRSTREP